MIMRTSLLLAGIMCTSIGSAQDSTLIHLAGRNAFGLEVTALLPIVRGTYGTANSYPYSLTYRRLLGSGWARLGVGGMGTVTDTEAEGWTNQNNSSHTYGWYNVRVGYAFRLFRERKWRANAGVDFFYSSFNSHRVSEYDDGDVRDDKDRSSAVGPAPMVEVHYALSPRIWIGTELNLQIALTQSETRTEYDLATQYNGRTVSKGWEVSFVDAASLFLFVNF